jgi:hypothetical protein
VVPANPKKLAVSWKFAGINPTFVLAAPRYGLRYGFAPATGNFQRLRGRPPLVSPFKSCIGRSFTAVTRVQNPVGDANKINDLLKSDLFAEGLKGFDKKESLARRVFSRLFCRQEDHLDELCLRRALHRTDGEKTPTISSSSRTWHLQETSLL